MQTLAIFVLGAAASTAFLLALAALARRGRPAADPGTGELVFRYSPRLRAGGCAFALAPQVLVGVMVLLHPPRDAWDAVCALLAHALFAALGGALVWDIFRFRLVVSSEGLDCRSPWRLRRFVRWEDVADVSFNGPAGWFEVRATGGGKVRLPALVGGLDSFLEACERHLAPDQLEPARMAYVFLARPFPGEGHR